MKLKKGRPSKDATEVERWTGRRWVKDDGKPGLAFSGKRPIPVVFGKTFLIPVAWYPASCLRGACGFNEKCICRRAMSRTSARWSCANGYAMERARKRK